MRRPKRHLTVAAACAVFAIVLFAGIAAAQTFGDKLRSGDTVTVPAGETVAHDLYIFAGATRIEGTVDGDLVATGGAIDVTGTVTGVVLAAGGTATINGTLGGDARIAG
ncbi:MAG TPA: hypothetical protein VK867_06465, partial [Candidatus Limnocylindrales bacterium]|nr:hypothetical protein [Candidatus Limnocylindrales bacterium]